jgi:hypothetical protein
MDQMLATGGLTADDKLPELGFLPVGSDISPEQ